MKLVCVGGPRAEQELEVREATAAINLPAKGGAYVREKDGDREILKWYEHQNLPAAIASSVQVARSSETPVRTFVAGMKAAAEQKGCSPCKQAWSAAQKVVGKPPESESA